MGKAGEIISSRLSTSALTDAWQAMWENDRTPSGKISLIPQHLSEGKKKQQTPGSASFPFPSSSAWKRSACLPSTPVQMPYCLGTRFSTGLGSVRFIVGLDELKCLLQPK